MITEHHDQLAAHPDGEEAAEPGGVVGEEEVEVLFDEWQDSEEGEAEGAGEGGDENNFYIFYFSFRFPQ